MENTNSKRDMTRINFEPILIGSRRYGVNEEDSDYDYLLIVPESKISDVLSVWGNADIVEYINTPDLSATLPVEAGYRIKGIANDDTASFLHTPLGALYDILVVSRPDIIPDSNFILENINLYRMLRMDEIIPSNMNINCALKDRLRAIRIWAKKNDVYGGVYPDGMGYLIYAINTLKKGYSTEKSIKMISTRCLYFHDEYKYKHISYVHEKAFKHMTNVYNNKVKEGIYQYQIMSKHMEEVLRLSKKLFDHIPNIMYIENNGIIHSSSDISDDIKVWSDWLQNLDIDIRIIEMK